MLIYLLQTSICWAFFYALYWFLYRNETFFAANRLYLLVTLVLSLVLPLDFSKLFLNPASNNNEVLTVYLQPLIIGTEKIEQQANHINLSYPIVLLALYFIGVAIFSIRLLIGFYKLFFIRKNSQIEQKNGYKIALTKDIHLPFSFGNTIYWSKSMENDDETNDLMLKHEIAHIKQWHTLDVLLVEILSVIFWCSPIIYFYKKSLRAVHEYLADKAATQKHSKQEYGSMLIRQLQTGMQPTIANSFISSQIKQRFAMMLKSSSPRAAYMKYVVCAPIILVLSIVLHQQSLKAQDSYYDAYGSKITKYRDFNFVESIDTIITFDPETFKESMKIVANKDSIYTNPDTPAEYIGGSQALMQYLANNIAYPKEAMDKKVEGKSFLEFVVNQYGFMSDIKVKKSSGNQLLDKEGERVLMQMLNESNNRKLHWKPATKDRKNVSCYFILPISFKL